MKVALTLFVLATVLFCGEIFAQKPAAEGNSGTGTVCVLPNSPEPPTRISPGGNYNPDTLKIGIDKREPILYPHKKEVRIENLLIGEQHLVVLTSDGKKIQSFRFKFADADDGKLCLFFDGYQGVQLMNQKNALWCHCR